MRIFLPILTIVAVFGYGYYNEQLQTRFCKEYYKMGYYHSRIDFVEYDYLSPEELEARFDSLYNSPVTK